MSRHDENSINALWNYLLDKVDNLNLIKTLKIIGSST